MQQRVEFTAENMSFWGSVDILEASWSRLGNKCQKHEKGQISQSIAEAFLSLKRRSDLFLELYLLLVFLCLLLKRLPKTHLDAFGGRKWPHGIANDNTQKRFQ